MSTAQILFVVALGTIAVVIVLFAVYVVSSTFWADRWVRKSK